MSDGNCRKVATEAYPLHSIKMAWWGCFGGVFIYSFTTVLLGGLPLGEGLKDIHTFKITVFLSALLASLIAVMLPFTFLGRNYIQRKRGARDVVASALLRMVLVEAAAIIGVAVFAATSSYEMYLPFPLISATGLLRLKSEEKFYSDKLNTLSEIRG